MSLLDKIRAWQRANAPELPDYPDPPKVVTDMTGATHRPLVLTPEMRQRMAHRVAIALPVREGDLIDRERRIGGLPVDVLMALEGLAMMAERGNLLAARILVEERQRLGIDPAVVNYGRQARQP